jgi:hypothetical protein
MARADYHAWYGKQSWRNRARQQLMARPLCEMCERGGRIVPAVCADHITPHRGDPKLLVGVKTARIRGFLARRKLFLADSTRESLAEGCWRLCWAVAKQDRPKSGPTFTEGGAPKHSWWKISTLSFSGTRVPHRRA